MHWNEFQQGAFLREAHSPMMDNRLKVEIAQQALSDLMCRDYTTA